jgi:cation:H+ antiporter
MLLFLLILGLMLLLAGGTALVAGASGIARSYGVSPLVVGLTVMAFGTSSPELVVNVVGALRGESELAFGNVAGSNLANLGLVLGLAALIKPTKIQGLLVRRELPFLLLGTSILLVMMMDGPLEGADAIVSRSDGLVLLLLFSVFVYIMVSDFMATRQDALIDNMRELNDALPGTREMDIRGHWVYVAAGVLGLGLGGHLTIVYGSEFAASLGVSPLVIGLIVVAIGTSLPELVTSAIAAVKNECDLCVGNVVGSNIFNSLVVLPISALLRPLPVPSGGLMDIFLSLVFAVFIIVLFFLGKARMGRRMGLVFIIFYLGYMLQRVLLA